MPLAPLPLPLSQAAHQTRPPADVRRLLAEARRRIARFLRAYRMPAFSGSDFGAVYAALRGLQASDLLTGHALCEWGSGFGVVGCMAAMLGFDACGIEAEGQLVDEARRLAADFDLPVEFVRGSFIPTGAEDRLIEGRELGWLNTGSRSGYEALGLDADEFDLIYAYPWPDEEGLIEELFEEHARTGALLLSYHGADDLRLCRKVDAIATGAPWE